MYKWALRPDVYVEIKYSECLPREDGALRVGKCLCLCRPLAKISEMEEQEDPYLNDRCRGESLLVPPKARLVVNEAKRGVGLLTGSVTQGHLGAALWLGATCKSLCLQGATGLLVPTFLLARPGRLREEAMCDARVQNPTPSQRPREREPAPRLSAVNTSFPKS